MLTKICSKCKDNKPRDQFFNIKEGPGGLSSRCKLCHNSTQSTKKKRAAALRYYAGHKEKQSKRAKVYYQQRRDQIIEKTLLYFHNNKEHRLAKMTEYRRSPRGAALNRLQANKRNRNIELATPLWANQDAIEQIYEQAARLQQQDGIPREVDHIIPLQSKKVCGLHSENNLQILTKDENSAKRCKFMEDWH
jgi:hypothetical protein